jgi:ABC-2 type transport system ATP-binding protein
MFALEAENVKKSFKQPETFFEKIFHRGKTMDALKGISLKVKEGEIFGLLGPNGAGKTTFIDIISNLILPDSGVIKVFGLDVVKQGLEVRRIVNLSSAYSKFYDELTTRENLEISAMYYGLKLNIKKIISLLDLDEYADKNFGDLSSGNQQKVVIARSLMTNPKLLLLDELTIALDPNIATKIRKIIKRFRRESKTTILLATHNMYEAEELCDRVAIIHRGKIVACDTVANLKKLVSGEDVLEISVDRIENPSELLLTKFGGVKSVIIQKKNNLIVMHVDNSEKRLQEILKTFMSKKFRIKSVKLREPTLEDVFMKLTGAKLE